MNRCSEIEQNRCVARSLKQTIGEVNRRWKATPVHALVLPIEGRDILLVVLRRASGIIPVRAKALAVHRMMAAGAVVAAIHGRAESRDGLEAVATR